MPRGVKFDKTGTENQSTFKGKWAMLHSRDGGGPTSQSEFYAVPRAPIGGYVIITKTGIGSNIKPAVRTLADDAELIAYTTTLDPANTYTTTAQCLAYYAADDEILCINKRHTEIVTDGLLLNIDPHSTASHTRNGTNINSLTNNGISAAVQNATVNADGTISLDGTNCYIEVVADGTTKGFNTQDWTLDCWINMANDGAYSALWSYDYTAHTSPFYAQLIYAIHSTSLRYASNLNSGTGYYSMVGAASMLVYNTWYNVTVTRDSAAGQVKFYKNGQLITTVADTTINQHYNQEVWIGRANFSTGYFKGDIGPYRFYNRTLSQTEIRQNHTATRSQFYPAGLKTELDPSSPIGYRGGNKLLDIDPSKEYNNTTLYNGVQIDPTDAGGALTFDGINDYIQTDQKPILVSAQQVTLECWYKITAANGTYQELFSYISPQGTTRILPNQDLNRIYVILSNQKGYRLISTGGYSYNQWNHLIVTMSTVDGLDMYWNGTNVYSEPLYNTVIYGSGANQAGGMKLGGGSGYWLKGKIGIIRAWDTRITASDAALMYNTSKSQYGY